MQPASALTAASPEGDRTAGSSVKAQASSRAEAIIQAALNVRSDLRTHKFTLRYIDTSDEDTYRLYKWGAARSGVSWSVLLLSALTLAFTVEYELSNYSAHPTLSVLVFVGRIPALLALLILVSLVEDREGVRTWWSFVAAACALVVLLTVDLMALLCKGAGDITAETKQCQIFASAGQQPWLPIALTSMFPFFLSLGLACEWVHVAGFGFISYCLYIGLVLAQTSGDAIATSLLAGLVPLVIACYSTRVLDRAIRSSFRREAAANRKLGSMIESQISAKVAAGPHQRVNDLMKRIDAAFIEVDRKGEILYASPYTRALLAPVDDLYPPSAADRGQLPTHRFTLDSIMRTSHLGYIHPDDQALVQRVADRLLTSVPFASRSIQHGTNTEAYPYARLQFRRLRSGARVPRAGTPEGAAASHGFVWVDCDMRPIVRKMVAIPGVANPAPAGEPTLLLIERDITAWRAAMQRQNLRMPVAAEVAASSMPDLVTAPPAAPPPPSSALLSAGMSDRTSASMTPEATARSGGAAAAGGAPTAAAGSAAGAGIMVPYDPYYERSMFTALASLQLPLGNIYAAAKIAASVWDRVLSLAVAGANATSGLPQPAASSPEANPTSAADIRNLSANQRDALQEVENALTALQDAASRGAFMAADAVAIARYRCQYLPVNPVASVNLRSALALAQLAARRKVAIVTSRRTQRIQPTVEPAVPETVNGDPVLVQLLLDAVLTAACDMARYGNIDVLVGPGMPMQLPAGSGEPAGAGAMAESIRIQVSFDASGAGGIDRVADALAFDCLEAGGPFTPGTKNAVDPESPRTRTTMEVVANSASHRTLLPLVRHIVLCLGATVTAGTDAPSESDPESSQRVIFQIDLPVPPLYRPVVGGPTCPDPVPASAAISKATVDSVPYIRFPLPAGLPAALSAEAAGGASEAGAAAAAAAAAVVTAAGGAADVPWQPVAPTPAPAAPSAVPALPQIAVAAAGTAAAPAPAAATAAAAAAAAAPLSGRAAAAAAAGQKERINPAESAGMHVLFVDDETTNRRLGAKMLARLGCSHEEIDDGDQVLTMLRDHAARGKPFDVILMDIVMQRLGGVKACEQLRAEGWDLPVVAMTGNTATWDMAVFKQAGFDLVLAKPFDVRGMQRALVEVRQRRLAAGHMSTAAPGGGSTDRGGMEMQQVAAIAPPAPVAPRAGSAPGAAGGGGAAQQPLQPQQQLPQRPGSASAWPQAAGGEDQTSHLSPG